MVSEPLSSSCLRSKLGTAATSNSAARKTSPRMVKLLDLSPSTTILRGPPKAMDPPAHWSRHPTVAVGVTAPAPASPFPRRPVLDGGPVYSRIEGAVPITRSDEQKISGAEGDGRRSVEQKVAAEDRSSRRCVEVVREARGSVEQEVSEERRAIGRGDCGRVERSRRSGERARQGSSRALSTARRQVPDRPPIFSQSASSPIVIDRSVDLHMS